MQATYVGVSAGPRHPDVLRLRQWMRHIGGRANHERARAGDGVFEAVERLLSSHEKKASHPLLDLSARQELGGAIVLQAEGSACWDGAPTLFTGLRAGWVRGLEASPWDDRKVSMVTGFGTFNRDDVRLGAGERQALHGVGSRVRLLYFTGWDLEDKRTVLEDFEVAPDYCLMEGGAVFYHRHDSPQWKEAEDKKGEGMYRNDDLDAMKHAWRAFVHDATRPLRTPRGTAHPTLFSQRDVASKCVYINPDQANLERCETYASPKAPSLEESAEAIARDGVRGKADGASVLLPDDRDRLWLAEQRVAQVHAFRPYRFHREGDLIRLELLESWSSDEGLQAETRAGKAAPPRVLEEMAERARKAARGQALVPSSTPEEWLRSRIVPHDDFCIDFLLVSKADAVARLSRRKTMPAAIRKLGFSFGQDVRLLSRAEADHDLAGHMHRTFNRGRAVRFGVFQHRDVEKPPAAVPTWTINTKKPGTALVEALKALRVA